MARHVGRPTNEEVAARKRKQMLKILIPVGLVTIVAIMIIGGTGLRGLMGASIDECSYECEEGWTADKNNICYLDIEDSTKNLSAYILGDANNDGVMNAQDFDLLNNDITNGVELDSVKESIYDINQDGEVNAEDIIAFNENISSMSTVGVVSNQILVCPKETITNEQDEEGNEITVTTNYELNNNQCIAKIKKEKQAKKVCTGVEGTGFYFTDTDNDDNVPSETTSSNESEIIEGDLSVCEDENETNECELDDETKYEEEIVNVDATDIQNLNEESDETINVNDDDIQELGYISSNSNYLNYSVDSQLGSTGSASMTPPTYGTFYLQNLDSIRYNDKLFHSITKMSIYYLYEDANCSTSTSVAVVIPTYSGPSLSTKKDTTNKGITTKTNTTKLLTYKVKVPEEKYKYIKQVNKPAGYQERDSKKNCISIEKYITTTDGKKKNSKGRVRISNRPNQYTIKVYNPLTKKSVKSINAYYGHTVKIDKINQKGYIFNGYTATRTYKNSKNQSMKQKLCYSNKQKTQKKWVTNSTKCAYGNYLFGKNGANITGINAVNGATITLTADFTRATYTIKYNLNGGKNNSSNPTKYNAQTNTITLKNPARNGYIFKGWYSDSKYKTRVTQIKKGSTGNKVLYAKWSRNTYTIKYNLNGGKNNSSNPTKYNVQTNTITLKNPTRNRYTFKGWYSDSKYKTRVTQIKKGSTGNKVLYARWSKK